MSIETLNKTLKSLQNEAAYNKTKFIESQKDVVFWFEDPKHILTVGLLESKFSQSEYYEKNLIELYIQIELIETLLGIIENEEREKNEC